MSEVTSMFFKAAKTQNDDTPQVFQPHLWISKIVLFKPELSTALVKTRTIPNLIVTFERPHVEELPPTPPGGNLENFCKMEYAVLLTPPGAFNWSIPWPRQWNLDLFAYKQGPLLSIFHDSQHPTTCRRCFATKSNKEGNDPGLNSPQQPW